MLKTSDWPKISIPISEYQFTDCVNIRQSRNGARLDVMIGFVTKHPEEKSIVLSSTWPGSNGFVNEKLFYIKRQDDWKNICDAVNELWPEVKDKVTEDEIRDAVKKVDTERKLLDVLVINPGLMDTLPNSGLLGLSEDQQKAVVKLLETGGEISANTITKLSQEPIGDLENFNNILENYRLATVNALVTHVTSRLNFIDIFEKAINDEGTYERRGEDSIHNLLRQNIWLVNQNYQILQDDTTLKNIIYQNWSGEYEGEDSGNRPDFLCMTEQTEATEFLAIIEIKKPSIRIVFKMVEQVLKYRQVLEANSENRYIDFHSLLIGKELDPLIKNARLDKSGIVVKTYSDFIGDARRFYREYLQLIQQNSKAI